MPYPKRTTEERFWRFVQKTPSCWLWTGARSGSGYGRWTPIWPGKPMMAHRWSYERFVGPIPRGLTVHHRCEVKLCVNPGHLELLTHRDNTLASDTPARRNLAKTHCPQGHLYAGTNLVPRKDNGRECRICHRARQARYQARRRA